MAGDISAILEGISWVAWLEAYQYRTASGEAVLYVMIATKDVWKILVTLHA